MTALWLLGRVPQDVLPWPLLRAERAGREPGPDVREAVFLRDGVAVAGDVEVHLPASDSRRHGHEGDPAYDGVMLHLVWEDDLGHAVPLAGGGSAPTVAIGPAPPTPEQLQARLHLGPLLPPPCAALAAARPAEVTHELVRAEGRRRLAEQVWRAARLAEASAGTARGARCVTVRSGRVPAAGNAGHKSITATR